MGVTVCQMSHSPDPFACLGRSHAINASRSKRSSGHIGNFRATDVHVLSLIFQFEGVGGFNALDSCTVWCCAARAWVLQRYDKAKNGNSRSNNCNAVVSIQ